ncbi:dihydrolipoyl dehydrogenase family protein [Streptomyces sp. KLOTTS4A1]|uniref:dihydrolipoyl dehydrogenase family protein n=1 Tax=Streptomyces sp. KLOTTS4A1 TaxID=3390996 RepID=UPI0039F584D3
MDMAEPRHGSGTYDLVVIGGGSAGLTAARTAGRLGARTLLVERDRLGGDCLWTGCVPSKALLHVAAEVRAARGVGRYGLAAVSGPVDLAAVLGEVRRAIAAVEPHDSAEALAQFGVEVAFGPAVFTGPRGLRAGEREVSFRYALIATGSAPALPPVPGLAEAEPLTSDSVWELEELPGRLVVLGGGSIGCELGQAFARLGSRVTLVEVRERLLAGEEPHASRTVRERLEAEGVTVLTGYRVEQVTGGVMYGGRGGVSGSDRPGDVRGSGDPGDVRSSGDPGDVHGSSAPGDSYSPGTPVPYDRLLVATGRLAGTGGLALEAAGVRLDGSGLLRLDARLRTTNPRVYAAGDVTGRSASTHLAATQGASAVTDALLGVRRRIDHGAVPQVTYTDPEVARVGLTAAEGARTLVLEHDRVDRAVAEGRTDGCTVLVLDARGRIAGATVVAPRAGEIIAHLATAVRLGLTPARFARTVHPYPTYADGPWHAALTEVYARLARGRRVTGALLGLRRAVRR